MKRKMVVLVMAVAVTVLGFVGVTTMIVVAKALT